MKKKQQQQKMPRYASASASCVDFYDNDNLSTVVPVFERFYSFFL